MVADCNVTNGFCDGDDSLATSIPLSVRVLLSVVLFVTVAISISGNFVVCFLVYRKPAMRSAINLLLAHIALSDILLSCLVMPFSLLTLLTESWLLGDVICRLLGFLNSYLVAVGVFVLLAISADRYLIISRKREKLNIVRARCLLLVTWLVAALLGLPPLFGWADYDFVHGQTLCLLKADVNIADVAYVLTYDVVTFYLPVFLMFCAFASIVHIVRKNGLKVGHHPGASSSVLSHRGSSDGRGSHSDHFQNISSRRSSIMMSHRPSVSVTDTSRRCFPVIQRRITVDMSFKTRAFKTIFILSVVLTFCWTPYVSLCLARNLSGSNSTVHQPLGITVAMVTGYIKSALNPIIYALRIKKFRDACQELMPKWLTSCRSCCQTKRRSNHVSVYMLAERSSI